MVKKAIKEYILITFGAVVAAAAIYFFMLPSHVAIGSGSALAMVLANFIPLPVSVISLSLNIILVERQRMTVVVGPAESFIGISMTAHEFGGIYRRRKYPKRPLMGPTLQKVAPQLPKLWEDSVKP